MPPSFHDCSSFYHHLLLCPLLLRNSSTAVIKRTPSGSASRLTSWVWSDTDKNNNNSCIEFQISCNSDTKVFVLANPKSVKIDKADTDSFDLEMIVQFQSNMATDYLKSAKKKVKGVFFSCISARSISKTWSLLIANKDLEDNIKR